METFCSKCGTKNFAQSQRCSSCGQAIVRISDTGKGAGTFLLNAIISVICIIYLINPTAGVLELIPDVAPLVGNLDEAAAMAALLAALSSLGLIPWRKTTPA